MTQFTFLFGFVSFENEYLPIVVAWSLFCEIIFYIFFPVFFNKITRTKSAGLYFFIAFFIANVFIIVSRHFKLPENNFYLFRSPIYSVQFFSLGILIYFLIFQSYKDTKQNHLWFLDLVAILSFIISFYERNINTLISIGAVIIAASFNSPVVGRICNNKVLKLYEKYCYSIYIFHSVIIVYFTYLIKKWNWKTSHFPELQFIGYYLVICAASLVMGHFFFHLLERRFIRMGNRLVARL